MTAKKAGRPSKYTPELVSEICARLSKGEPLAKIGRDEGMPAYRTVKDWMDEDSERGRSVSAAIACAREEGFDAIAQEAMEIADDCRNDFIEDLAEKGDKKAQLARLTGEVVARSRLRVETRLKLLAKWDPKRYGEGMTVRGDKDAPIGVSPVIIIGAAADAPN